MGEKHHNQKFTYTRKKRLLFFFPQSDYKNRNDFHDDEKQRKIFKFRSLPSKIVFKRYAL